MFAKTCIKRLSWAALASAGVAASPAAAQFVGPDWDRPITPGETDADSGALTSYQEWDQFEVAVGPATTIDFGDQVIELNNHPDQFDINPAGTANVEQTIDGAFITSTDNIYSPSAVLNFEVTIPVPEFNTALTNDLTLAIQTQTLGTTIDPSTVSLSAGASTYSPVQTQLLASGDTGSGFGGLLEANRYLFTIPDFGDGDAATLDTVTFNFAAAETSLSLDRLAVDTATLADGFLFTPPVTLGDMNGDGSVTNGDIAAFVLALTDPSAYASNYDPDPDTAGDFNGDGVLTNGDIAGFVDLLTGTASSGVSSSELSAALSSAVPEPGSLALVTGLGAIVLVRRRRR